MKNPGQRQVLPGTQHDEGLFVITPNHVPGMLAFFDADHCCRFANEYCEAIFDAPPAEIVGKNLRELVDRTACSLIESHVANLLERQQIQFEFPIETKRGLLWCSASCVHHEKGGGFFALFVDITARVEAQNELEREVGLFEGVVQGVPDSLMLASLDRKITFCNPGTQQIFGYEPDELVGQPTRVLYASLEDYEAQGKLRFRPDADTELVPVEVMMRKKSGESFPAELVGTILKTHQGERLGFLGLIRDISQRKEAEAARQRHFRVLDALSTGTQLDDLLKLTVETAEEARPGMIGSILLLDDAKERLTSGYTGSLPDEYNRAVDGLQIGPEVGSCGAAAFRGERVLVEEIATHPNWQSFRELAESASLRACWSEPIISPNNDILGTLAMYFREPQTPAAADLNLLRQTAQLAGVVVDRARTNELVQQSEERYRSLVEASSSVVWTTSPDGHFVAPQHAWEEYTGQPWEEHQADGWLKMICAQDQERIAAEWKVSLKKGTNYRSHGRMWHHASQAYRYFEVQAVPIRDKGRQIIEWVGSTTDVHVQRTADQALQVNEERLSLAFSATNDAIWDWDLSNDSVWWNEAHQNQFGHPPAPADYWQWWGRRIHPSDRQRVRDSLDAFAAGDDENDRWNADFRFRRDDGSYAHIVDRALRARDANGRPVRVLGAMQDISMRRALEKQILETASETHRMIGHDLHDGVGQELTGLTMLADSLTEWLRRKSLHAEEELAEKIGVGLERTLSQVRDLARGMNPVQVDPQGLASALVELADHASQIYEIECEFSCSDELFVNDSETATQLYRIAQEAITNAVKHGKATRINIELLRCENSVALNIVDDGVGISHEDFKKGVGMRSMDYRADVIGGKLQIIAGQSKGTVVSCTLPARTCRSTSVSDNGASQSVRDPDSSH